MKAGDVVTVYEDPWTRQRPEGEADLVEKKGLTRMDGSEVWFVRFRGDSHQDIYERVIVPKALAR